MNKTLFALFLSCSLSSYGQGTRFQPGSVPTPVPVFNTIQFSNLIYSITVNVVSNVLANQAYVLIRDGISTNQTLGMSTISNTVYLEDLTNVTGKIVTYTNDALFGVVDFYATDLTGPSDVKLLSLAGNGIGVYKNITSQDGQLDVAGFGNIEAQTFTVSSPLQDNAVSSVGLNSEGKLTTNNVPLSSNAIQQILNNTTLISTIAPFSFSSISNMTLISQTTLSNTYWWNCGITNLYGQTNIYQSLIATNDIVFAGLTNQTQGSLLSYNVYASGGTRGIFIPTNKVNDNRFDTNGLVITNNFYLLRLTNGNELRMTIQANVNGNSFLWRTFGQ
jgi:hypothetical protein